MFRPAPASIPLDLAIELSALYAVRRAKREEISGPVLTVIPTLRELAVATMLDNLLEAGSGMLTLPERYKEDMISMLPLDVPLSRVFCITDDSYWIRRYRYEFGCSDCLPRISDPRAFYLEALLSKLLLASSFNAADSFDANKQATEVLELGGPIIKRLILHIQACGVDLGAVFAKLPSLAHIQVIYDMPNIQPSSLLGSIDMHKPSTSNLLATSDTLVIKGRALPELSLDIKDPAAPFHRLPDYNHLGMLLHRDVCGTTIPTGCLHEANKAIGGTPERLVELLDTFRYIQYPLQSISMVSSALNSEAACVLAKGLQDMSFKLASTRVGHHLSIDCLDLSYNNIGDGAIHALSKLFVDSEKHSLPAILTSLRLTANLVTKAGCVFLAKAIGQPKSRLRALTLNGNSIETDGYTLLANGILKAAIKYSNNHLTDLGLAACGIVLDASAFKIITKFIQRTALECIDLGGNVLIGSSVQPAYPARSESPISASTETKTRTGDVNLEDTGSDTILENLSSSSKKEENLLIAEFKAILEALRARYDACKFENGVFQGCGTPCILTLPEDFDIIPENLYRSLHEINHQSSLALKCIVRTREAACEPEDLHKPAVDIL
ncbi:hypothetical protein GL50803_0017506 [Giardia duodenalis]|uniref:Uncharacterized protein n=1 Tax=Giardia intestinalis (strain ATCC 50803 / WB clone C6) TaxID=184922 RepID=A8B6X6_GIAIC|nr:hypothetical protein GL50803_0017506 [Giardia intestinalis]KAE8301831.1 hypothetical protein GL50803_0017506 [Giardia intestinalis]|eukprot:XP_001709082.1 Hypothetical protein GL50803_17506 [Giardia lamblia ATCC 50803]